MSKRKTFLIESRIRPPNGKWGPWEIDYGFSPFDARIEAFETAGELNSMSKNLQYRMTHYVPIETRRKK